MSKLQKQFHRIFELTAFDEKPLYGILAHLTSELGELAEAVQYHEGHLLHKELNEPIIGEIADVIQSALSILTIVTPEFDNEQRFKALGHALQLKNDKWETTITDASHMRRTIQLHGAKKPNKKTKKAMSEADNLVKKHKK